MRLSKNKSVEHGFGGHRAEPKWRWVTWGSGVAGAVWLVGSPVLSWYVANFGSYNATYGSLGAVIGFMIWMWLSTMVVLVGGEINAELEHQTARDTDRRQSVRPIQPTPDLARASVGALGAAFELGFVPEPVAQPAPEARPAVEDAARAIAPRAPEPTARSPERCRRRPDFDALVDDLG